MAEGDGEGDTFARTLGLGVSPGDAAGEAAGEVAVAVTTAGVAGTFGFGFGVGVGVEPVSGGVTPGGAHSAVSTESDNAASTVRSAKSFLIRILSN